MPTIIWFRLKRPADHNHNIGVNCTGYLIYNQCNHSAKTAQVCILYLIVYSFFPNLGVLKIALLFPFLGVW